MGYFVAYRHTGADPERLEALLPVVRDSLIERGKDVYCTYFDETQFKKSGLSAKQIMDHAFSKIEDLNGLLVVIDSEDKSEGMLMEVGFCVARDIPIVAAKQKAIEGTYVPSMATYSLDYEDIDDLRHQILTDKEI